MVHEMYCTPGAAVCLAMLSYVHTCRCPLQKAAFAQHLLQHLLSLL